MFFLLQSNITYFVVTGISNCENSENGKNMEIMAFPDVTWGKNWVFLIFVLLIVMFFNYFHVMFEIILICINSDRLESQKWIFF